MDKLKYSHRHALNLKQRFLKRAFDICVALIGLSIFSPIILAAWFIASIDTGQSGMFSQKRIGKFGQVFILYKIRTMKNLEEMHSSVTTSKDPRITKTGRILRRFKIDELPQLINVLFGHMSLVGPRPDVPGFADRLTGKDKLILAIRPGITGLASIIYRNEELLLSEQKDPERYNAEIVWPNKIKLNTKYIESYSFGLDIKIILATVGLLTLRK